MTPLRCLMLLALVTFTACNRQNEGAAKLPPTPTVAATPAARDAPAPAEAPAVITDHSTVIDQKTTGSVLTGTTEPFHRSTLTPKASGSVARVLVREGDRVKKGQTLVRLDTSDFRLRLEAAQAAANTAKAQVNAARIEHKRLSGLLADKAIPRSQFDKVDSQLNVGIAGLAQAKVAVKMARTALSYATVRAPFAGIITMVFVSQGEYAAMMPPKPLVTVEEVDRLYLRLQVPESFTNRVKKGTSIVARFGAVGLTKKAKITRIVASLNPRTRSFSALAELDNRDGSLRPGMFAEVDLPAATPTAAKQKER